LITKLANAKQIALYLSFKQRKKFFQSVLSPPPLF